MDDVTAVKRDEQTRGERIRNFLNDELIKGVLHGLELSYFQAWKDEKDPTARETLHATVRAFDDLIGSLQAIVASGERATLDLAAQELETD